MNKIKKTLIFLSVVGMHFPALAADLADGKAKATICAACHGANGISIIPGYPNLKGQNEQYLISAIKAYKSKARTGGLATLMQSQAAALTDEDIANVAAYYSSLK